MNESYTAALIIDIASKQDYIFSSNKLKLNIGASFIISEVVLVKVLNRIIDKNYAHTSKVVNIGGGNAIIYFIDDTSLKGFVGDFSAHIIENYPGVNLEFGKTHLNKEEPESFKQIRMRLNSHKNERRSSLFLTNAVDLGIAKECKISGDPANAMEDGHSVSLEVKTKNHASKVAQSKVQSRYNDLLKDQQLVFSSIGSEFAPEKTKAFLSVVHIDGNKIGDLFKKINTEDEFVETSDWLEAKLSYCLREVIKETCSLIQDGSIRDVYGDHSIDLYKIEDPKSADRVKYVLPFRSIINAGDDITFICHGKLGIYLAEKYIKLLGEEYQGKPGIPACAGIAITHVNHPFYKAYKIAEELCQNAKKASRIDENPRLHYMVFKEGISGTLEDIWLREYTSQSTKFKRDALTLTGITDSPSSFYRCIGLFKNIKYGEGKWPTSKLQRIIKSLHFDDIAFDSLLLYLKSSTNQLDYQEALSGYSKSDLLEASELIEFYPIFSKSNSTLRLYNLVTT